MATDDAKECRILYGKLIARGNLKYNRLVKSSQLDDDYILKYENTEKIDENKIVPCKHCFNMYRTSTMSRHKCVEDYKKNRKEGEKIKIVEPSKVIWHGNVDLTPSSKALFETLR